MLGRRPTMQVLITTCAVALAGAAIQTLRAADEPSMRVVQANGIKLRIAEMGRGPLVIFVHGFPESWYSWRHQLPAIAQAGFHVVAPDLRGYGKSDKPAAVDA